MEVGSIGNEKVKKYRWADQILLEWEYLKIHSQLQQIPLSNPVFSQPTIYYRLHKFHQLKPFFANHQQTTYHMFSGKSFNFSGILSRSKEQSRTSSVIEPRDQYNDSRQQEIQKLKEENSELKQQLQKLKQIFIEARINYDNQIRAYDELLDQIRTQLTEKQNIIEKYYMTFKGQCNQIQQQEGENDQEHEKQPQPYQGHPGTNKNEISELMLQSSISFQHKFQASLQQIEALRNQCQRLKHQLLNQYQKNHTMNTNDVSFTGKGQSKISFNFGDITAELKDVEEIAEFSHERSRITVDQQEINVRDQRIENLERQNIELQNQMASKSHKLARIFNAAYEFGGMHLLDFLQNSIGLIEEKDQEID